MSIKAFDNCSVLDNDGNVVLGSLAVSVIEEDRNTSPRQWHGSFHVPSDHQVKFRLSAYRLRLGDGREGDMQILRVVDGFRVAFGGVGALEKPAVTAQ